MLVGIHGVLGDIRRDAHRGDTSRGSHLCVRHLSRLSSQWDTLIISPWLRALLAKSAAIGSAFEMGSLNQAPGRVLINRQPNADLDALPNFGYWG